MPKLQLPVPVMKIIAVEDGKDTRNYLAKGLIEEGHSVDSSADGAEGMEFAQARNYDIAIIDQMLPGLDGLTLVRTLRQNGIATKVIFLTSLGGIDDRDDGLDAGGDDYLAKPFAFSQLLARLNAIARRPSAQPEAAILRIADPELDIIQRTVGRAGVSIALQQREFALLEYMVKNRGRVLTRTMLLERVWRINFEPRTNVVETHISRLRSKIDRAFQRKLIHTVHGIGYRVDDAR